MKDAVWAAMKSVPSFPSAHPKKAALQACSGERYETRETNLPQHQVVAILAHRNGERHDAPAPSVRVVLIEVAILAHRER